MLRMIIIRFFSLWLLSQILLVNGFSQVLVKGKIYNAATESVMVEYTDPVFGNVHFFESALVDGRLQHEFNVDKPVTINIHILNQIISIYALPGAIMQFDCDADDVYGTLNFDGKFKDESIYLSAFNELDAFVDKFKNNATEHLSKREQLLFENSLQSIGEPGSDQTNAFIKSYTDIAKQKMLSEYAAKAVCKSFKIQYLDTTFQHLMQTHFPIRTIDIKGEPIREKTDYELLIQQFKDMKIDNQTYLFNEAYRKYIEKLFVQEKEIRDDKSYINLPFNVDSFLQSKDGKTDCLAVVIIKMIDAGEALVIQTDTQDLLKQRFQYLEKLHSYLKGLFSDDESIYQYLIFHRMKDVSYRDGTSLQTVQYLIENYPNGKYNATLLEKIKMHPFLAKGNSAPQLSTKNENSTVLDFSKNNKITLLTFGADWSLTTGKEWNALGHIIPTFSDSEIDFVFVNNKSSCIPKTATYHPSMASNIQIYESNTEMVESYNAYPLPRFYIIGKDGKIITTNASLPSYGNALKNELKSAIANGCIDCE